MTDTEALALQVDALQRRVAALTEMVNVLAGMSHVDGQTRSRLNALADRANRENAQSDWRLRCEIANVGVDPRDVPRVAPEQPPKSSRPEEAGSGESTPEQSS